MKGMSDFLKNLNNTVGIIKTAGAKGLASAAIVVKGESMKICPVDKGLLINSAYTNPMTEKGTLLSVELGYSQDYAPYVHEMPANTNWQKPGAENKFLEKALLRNEKKVNSLIQADLSGSLK